MNQPPALCLAADSSLPVLPRSTSDITHSVSEKRGRRRESKRAWGVNLNSIEGVGNGSGCNPNPRNVDAGPADVSGAGDRSDRESPGLLAAYLAADLLPARRGA